MSPGGVRLPALAAVYGLIAGAVAAVVLWLMGVVTDLVWSGPDARWYVFVMILVGGVLIALLQRLEPDASAGVGEQVDDLRNPARIKRRAALFAAAGAIVAVGFGGAIGPEAGILAVVSQLSALIGLRLSRDAAEARLLSEAGTAGALGGLYGSPPAGAVVAQENPEVPRWQLYLAGLTGFLGFVAVHGWLGSGHGLRLHLPPHEPSPYGTDMLDAVLPALLGAAAGLGLAWLTPAIRGALGHLRGKTLQILVGTVAFAALATAWPLLRFSGQQQMGDLADLAATSSAGTLLALAALKVVAVALCVASGWRGGVVFPLIFIGAAAALAVPVAFPSVSVTVAVVAGAAAAMTAGVGKPLAAALIAVLILGIPAVGPLCVGIAIGWAASKIAPEGDFH